jgi:hypothetical protein
VKQEGGSVDSTGDDVLESLELFGDVGERAVTDFYRPVRFETSSGSFFLLLPANASSRAAWECGSTLFAIPCAGDPTKVSSVLELLVLTPAARMLRIASLTSHGRVLRVQLLLDRAVGGPIRDQR